MSTEIRTDELLDRMKANGAERMDTEDLRDLQSQICGAMQAPKTDAGKSLGYILLSAMISAILAGREPKTGG
jgi:hypothetical protein